MSIDRPLTLADIINIINIIIMHSKFRSFEFAVDKSRLTKYVWTDSLSLPRSLNNKARQLMTICNQKYNFDYQLGVKRRYCRTEIKILASGIKCYWTFSGASCHNCLRRNNNAAFVLFIYSRPVVFLLQCLFVFSFW